MLTVVQDEKGLRRPQVLGDKVNEGPFGMFAYREQAGKRLDDQAWLCQRGQLDKPDPPGELQQAVRGRFKGEAAFTGTANAYKGNQPTSSRKLPDLRQLPLTADECGELTGQVVRWFIRNRGNQLQGAILAQDGGMQPPQLAARFNAKPLHQQLAHLLVRPQGLTLAAATVLGEHELSPEPLTQRMLSNEHLKLGNHIPMAPQRQISFQPVLQSLKAKRFQARDLGSREQLVRHLDKRRPTPQRERLAQFRAGADIVAAGQGLTALGG
jgi:hypothetical protein